MVEEIGGGAKSAKNFEKMILVKYKVSTDKYIKDGKIHTQKLKSVNFQRENSVHLPWWLSSACTIV